MRKLFLNVESNICTFENDRILKNSTREIRPHGHGDGLKEWALYWYMI